MSKPLECKILKVTLMIVDRDGVEEQPGGVAAVIENTKFPNRCISPHVVSVEARTVIWGDNHPLNKSGWRDAFANMFGREPKERP